MDKSSFFSSLGGYLKANRAFFLIVVFILLATGGYFWWQAGFTLEIGRFFASCSDGDCDEDGYLNPTVRGDDCNDNDVEIGGDPECRICAVPSAELTCGDGDCDDDGVDNPAAGGDDCDDANWCTGGGCPPPEPTATGSATPSPIPTSGGPACPCGGDAWTENGVTVCKSGGNIDMSQRCTTLSPGTQASVTLTICNRSSVEIYSRQVLYYTDQQTCGAHAGGTPGRANRSGSDRVAPGANGSVTYSFNIDSCGSWQLDDTWGPNENSVFVVGQVINTGVSCPTPPPASPSTSPSTPPASPSTSPSTPPASPSTSPSTPPASPSASPSSSPAPLSCAATVTQAAIGQAVQFVIQGGSSPYTWHAPGGTPESNIGPAFSASFSYATPGFKTVTVVSGNDQAACTVTVLEPVTSSPPPSALACAPTTQTVGLNAYATVNATGGSGAFTWATPNGTKDPATNCVNTATCRVSYSVAGSYDVTVSDQQSGSTQTAVCKVVVASAGQLLCAPSNQSVKVGQKARFDASGAASGSYSWSAPSGSPTTATGASFETSYESRGAYVVTVTQGTRTATCNVEVTKDGGGSYTHTECRNNTCTRVNGQGTSECFPEGSSCGSSSSPRLALTKLVRNIAQGSGEGDSVTANPTDTVEFSLRVSSNGSGTVRSVTIRDSLPAGLTYAPGSTIIDSVAASDGIISSGLSLGDMPSGRTITIRFRATVSPASFFSSGTSVLTNTGYARGSNVPEVSDSAFVTVMNAKNLNISLTKMGRNVTRGETGERSPVRSSPAQTIEFVMRVRNTSANALNNVIIRDILPQEITLVAGSVRVGGVVAADVITAAGLSLGTLTPGQEVAVVFSGLVAPESQLPSGNTTVINTATVTATGIPTLSAQLPIVITNGIVVPPVETGPGETTVLALIISAIITLLYVGYTSTETYRRREATDIAKDSRGGMSDFNT